MKSPAPNCQSREIPPPSLPDDDRRRRIGPTAIVTGWPRRDEKRKIRNDLFGSYHLSQNLAAGGDQSAQ
jgi:hypothetical protein